MPTHLADQTNLALRQVGHQLLALEGNDSISIPPILHLDPQVFLLELGQSFYYDTLPPLLHVALADLGMGKENYYVSIKDCEADSLILGYDVRQFLAGKVPCIGRQQYVECNHIYVTFPNREQKELSNSHWVYLLVAPFLLSLYLFSKKVKLSTNKEQQMIQMPILETESKLQHFGHCKLDASNQYLYIKEERKSLTYREAKLLKYFVDHANQLLKREKILEDVWEDERIIVGRSLDVFVSRLRKLLKDDATLQIKTVHGIGYRLVVGGLRD